MKPNNAFLDLPKNFWACVRLISQEVGYTEKTTRNVKIPAMDEIQIKLEKFDINFSRLQSQVTSRGQFGRVFTGLFCLPRRRS
jgi:hypothetical protein